MGEQTAKAPGLNRAKTYQLVLFPLNNGATNVYYVLVLSYIATFGSKVLALSMIFASVMVTGMRLFDAYYATCSRAKSRFLREDFIDQGRNFAFFRRTQVGSRSNHDDGVNAAKDDEVF